MRIIDVEGIGRVEFPDSMSLEQIQESIEKELIPQYPEVAAQRERGLGEIATDVAASVGVGTGRLLQVPGQLGQLAGLFGPEDADTGLQGLGKSLEEGATDLKSTTLVGKEQLRAQKVGAAEGFFPEFVTAFKETLFDPTLLSSFLLEQVPNLIGSMGGGLLARGGVSLLMRQASEAAIGKAGITGAVGTGAAMQGADVGTETYERIAKELLAQGVPAEEANERALTRARQAAIQASALTIGTSMLPGGSSIERFLAGKGAAGVGGALRAGVGEFVSEGIEEGGGQALSNVGVAQEIPGTSLLEGVGEATAMGSLAGGLFGAPAGGLSGRRNARAQAELDKVRAASEQGKKIVEDLETAEQDARRAAFEAEQAETQRSIFAERYRNSPAYAELETKVNKIKERADNARKKLDNEYTKISAFTGAEPDLFGQIFTAPPETSGIGELQSVDPRTPQGAPIPVQEGQLELDLPSVDGQAGLPGIGIAQPRAPQAAPLPATTVSETGQLDLPGMNVGRVSTPITETDFSNLGINKTNKKLRSQILGKDLGVPAQAAQVKRALENYASSPDRSGAITTKVEQFLQRPEFAVQLPLGIRTTSTAPVETAPVDPTPTITEASLDGLTLPKRSAARKRLLGKNLDKPADRKKVTDELQRLAANPSLNPETRQRVRDVLAGSPFIRTQGELFGPQGGVTRAARQPTPEGTDARTTDTPTPAAQPAPRRQPSQRGVAVDSVGSGATAPATSPAGEVSTPDVAGLADAGQRTQPDAGRGAGVPPTVTDTAPTDTAPTDTAPTDTAPTDTESTVEKLVDITDTETQLTPTNTETPKGKRQTLAEQYAGEYEVEYADLAATMPRAVMTSSADAGTLVTPKQKILEMVAGDIYVKGEKSRKAKVVYNSLPQSEKAVVDATIERFKQNEKSGKRFVARMDRLRAEQDAFEGTLDPNVAEAIRSNVLGRTSPKLIAAVYNNRLVDALQEIASNPIFDPVHRAIARRILNDKRYPLSRIQVVPKSSLGSPNAAGQYVPNTDTIQIADGEVDSHTVLHETVHGFLHAAISDFEAGRFENKALSNLRDLFNHLKQTAPNLAQGENTSYAMTSLTEFAAEAMSNPVLQAELAKIPYKDSNIFTKFARFVMDLLGVSSGANNALAAALIYGERSFNFGRSYQQSVGKNARIQPAKVVRATLEDISNRAGGASKTPPPKTAFQSVSEAVKPQKVRDTINKIQTRWFSSDAAFSNRMWDELSKNPDAKAAIKDMQSISTSQALHAEGMADNFLEKGNIQYNPETYFFEAVNDPNSYNNLITTLKEISEQEGVSFDVLKQYANQAFIAERIDGMSKTDKDFYTDMTPAQIKAGQEFFTAIPRLREVQKIWNGMRSNAMKVAVDSGLYTTQEAKDLLNVMDYVPFFREDQVATGAGPKQSGRGLLDFTKGRKIKGSDQKVNDIFDNMSRWTSYTIAQSVKNRAANNMLSLAKRVFPEEVTELRQDETVRNEERQNVMDIYVGGKKKRIKFADPFFVDAFGSMASITIPLVGGVGGFFRKTADVLRQTVVLMPLFSISQLPQDSLSAMSSSGLNSPFRLPIEIFKEFYLTLVDKSSAHERLSDIAAAGRKNYGATVDRHDTEIRTGVRKEGVPRKILGALEKFAMASDNAVRQGIYNRTLLETGGVKLPDGGIRGGDEATAMRRAFEVINFKRSGNSGFVQVGKQVIPFFGAYLQAMNVMYKVAMGKGISPQERGQAWATLATTTAKVMALSFMYTALVADDEEYQEMDPAMRDRTLMIPGTSFRVPMRPDIFLLPKMIGEYTYLGIMDDGFTDATKMKRGIRDSLSNIILGPTAVPQALKPAIEVGLNYSFFTGRPIIGRGLETKETALQYSNYSTELAKILGKTGLIAPVNADHLMRGYFGTVGGMANFFISSAVRTADGRSLPEVPLPDDIASIPGMSPFVTRTYGTGIKNDFYELRKEVDKAVSSINWLKKYRPRDEVIRYMDENRDLIALRTPINRIVKQLSTVREQERKTREAPDSRISAKEKGEIIERLRLYERRLLEQVSTLRQRAGM